MNANKKKQGKWKGFMALALSLSLIGAGCSNSPAGTENPSGEKGAGPVKISYWTPFSGGDGEFMAEMVKKFNAENKDIQVEQLNMKFDDYYTKLATAVASDQAPDVTVMHSTRLPQFTQAELLLPLDETASATGVNWGDFNQNILDSTVFDSKHYAIPLDTHLLVMYYNKKHLQQAGVLGADGKPVIKPGADGFVEFLQTIKDKVDPTVAPLAQPNVRIDAYWMWWAFYSQMKEGGKLYTEDGAKSAINNPAALQSLNYVNDLYKKQLIPPNINDAFKMFGDGKAAVLMTGVWGVGAFENNPNVDLGVAPVPQIYDQPGTWGDSHTLALPKHAKQDEAKTKAALTFANWIAQNSTIWAKAGHIPAVTKVLESSEYKAMKHRSDYAASADYVKYFSRNPKQWPINDMTVKEFEAMMAGTTTPEQTLKNIEDKANKMINE